MTQKTYGDVIEKIHEKVDDDIWRAIRHYDSDSEIFDEKADRYDLIQDYLYDYSHSFHYIAPQIDRARIFVSETGYWSYHIAKTNLRGTNHRYEYRFYMNEALQDEPDIIKFWCINNNNSAHRADIRLIGTAIWDSLKHTRHE